MGKNKKRLSLSRVRKKPHHSYVLKASEESKWRLVATVCSMRHGMAIAFIKVQRPSVVLTRAIQCRRGLEIKWNGFGRQSGEEGFGSVREKIARSCFLHSIIIIIIS